MKTETWLRSIITGVLLLTVMSCSYNRLAASHRDVVVYGGTPAGVAAAVAAARQGSSVTLVTEGRTVGGMMSNGISASDIGSTLAVQGLAAEFFATIRAFYSDANSWRFEPHVAEQVLRAMLKAAHVDVRYNAPLVKAKVEDRKIQCISVSDDIPLCANTYIDATYTGDLIAAARVPYRLGMEDLYGYNEALAARRGWRVMVAMPPGQDAAGKAAFQGNPFVKYAASLPPYSSVARNGMPSLTYRLCVTPIAQDRRPFMPAPNYKDLVPSFRYLAEGASPQVVHKPNGSVTSAYYQLSALPSGKYDLNSGDASFTNIPAPKNYFTDTAGRKLDNQHLRQYVESFFYFVQHDPSVPAAIQQPFSKFGLCADEFVDNGNWPYEPYVREGRRLSGRYTFTQNDIYVKREKSSAVALGSYDLDGKSSQVVYADGALYRDVGVHERAPVYEIPYGIMVPRQGGVVNLLAPIGVSSSPTAYGSLRVEPQYMAMGQAAGVAASVAVRSGRSVAAVPVSKVQAVLASAGVIYKIKDICERTPVKWRTAAGFSADCHVLPVTPQPKRAK